MNRILSVFALLFVLASCGSPKAEVAVGPVSASTNAPGCEYPKVNPDLSVEFRACFPEAKEVAVDICSKVYPMAKAENGEWTVTVDPQEPGSHPRTWHTTGEKWTEAYCLSPIGINCPPILQEEYISEKSSSTIFIQKGY